MSAASFHDEKTDSFQQICRLVNVFGSRASRFALCKGAMAAATTLFTGLYLLILLDASGWMADIVRWISSVGVYSLALAIGWRYGGSRFFSYPTTIQLANEIEKGHSHFAERLSSSVELHAEQASRKAGSSVFVETLDQQALRELRRVDLQRLVPWQTLHRWIGLLCVLSAVYLALSCTPGLQFPKRVARVMLPFVEMEALSQWSLRILSPEEPDFVVPSEHKVVFRLSATSVQENEPTPKQSHLEWRESSSVPSQAWTHKMFPLKRESTSSDSYTTIVPVGDRTVEYRFLFGGAKTKWQKVSPVSRPRVMTFRWKIDFPLYSLLPSETRTNETGDLRVLKNSRLRLSLDVDQPLEAASILLENAESGLQQRFDLQKSSTSLVERSSPEAIEVWQCEVDGRSSGRFQVNLESKQQIHGEPIRNTFSPWYKLDMMPDPPAVIDWIITPETPWPTLPRENEPWMLQPDDWVAITSEVHDNLPILSLSTELSINDQNWTELELQRTSSTDEIQTKGDNYYWKPSLRWDVASSNVTPGDLVSLRLKVVDRAENTSYSAPLKFSIASTGFDSDRHAVLEKRALLIPLLEKFKLALNSSQEDLLKTIAQFQDAGVSQSGITGPDHALHTIENWAESASLIANDIQIAIETLMPQIDRCIDQNELELVARGIARIQRERLSSIQFDCNQQTSAERAQLSEKTPEWVKSVHKETCDRLMNQVKSAGRDANRLFEIYQAFVSLELQTALTKDTTFLWAHQQKQLVEASTRDMPSLVRSQRVAHRYWQLANELAIRIAPFVRPEFAKRIPEWQQWMGDSRQEIRDLCDQNGDDNAKSLLIDRIHRDASELEGQRWIYKYDGSLFSRTNDLRRELVLLSGSIAPQFSTFSTIHSRRKGLRNNPSLSSQELAIQNRYLIEFAEMITGSIKQLEDRRDVHQLRKNQDPKFGADMGLAWRAWNAVFEQWKTESPMEMNKRALDLASISAAYRTLEAAHEIAEAKLALSSLQSPERYDFQSLEGRLQHYRQWESVSSRLDLAQRWMRTANFPIEISDRYNAMRQSKPFVTAQSKLASRRDPQNKSLVSAAQEIDALVKMWNEIDQLALPVLENARRVLSQFAPSIAELSKIAAESTRQLQQQTDDLAKADSTSNSQEMKQQLREQLNNVNEQVKTLQEALVEQAAQQDLLQRMQRELARDSDRALRLVDDVANKMNDSLANALDANDESKSELAQSENANATREEAIKHAKVDQQKAIDTLENIAGQFDGKNKPSFDDREGQTATSESLDRNESSNPIDADAKASDLSDYRQAEALEQQLRESPETMLKQLEDELRKNPLMQNELSAISKSQAMNATTELMRAAQTEKEITLRLENEDVELFESKKRKSDRLQALVVMADRTAAKTLERAAQMSERANLQENQMTILSLYFRLRNAFNDARQVNEQIPAAEQDQAIATFSKRVAEIGIVAQSITEISERSIRRPIEKNEQSRINKVNEAKNAQSSLRDEMAQNIKQILNQWRDASQRANQKATQPQENAGSIENQLDDLAVVVEARFQEMNKERASLDHPNPYGALATEQITNSNQWLDELLRQIKELDVRSQGAKPPAPPESTLSRSASSQSDLRSDLERIAEDVDRSARHELRLGNEQGSSQLLNQSNSIREIENGIVKKAEESLTYTSEQAGEAESIQSKLDANGNAAKRLNRPSAANSMEHLRQAEDALIARANEMASLTGTNLDTGGNSEPQSPRMPGADQSSVGQPPQPTNSSNPSSDAATGSSPSAQTSASEQLTANRPLSPGGTVQQKASEMARILDQLDRDIYAQQNPSETGDSKQNGETDVSRSDPNSGSNKIRNGKGNMSSARQSAIESSAQQLASEMNQSRMEQLNRNPGGQTYLRNQKGAQSGGEGTRGPNPMEKAEDYSLPNSLPNSQSTSDRDWGKLRTQRAVDVKEGTRESFDPEFDQAIRAYYQAISDAAAGK